ncbi:hypothetical protein HELRODRAFT_163070 [Helobdella robusta]|uniref:Uncharacterized protein n=1 Tax=Helobdella robusta TaxID=6412 RepID=T1ETM4_HELRO|nr:hypothetical protein HELRODRAFT_163070 [Helobdella robusta]ESN96043.1 hypothetical protein HELRODRAFT_163070 [Helobdella robusta]
MTFSHFQTILKIVYYNNEQEHETAFDVGRRLAVDEDMLLLLLYDKKKKFAINMRPLQKLTSSSTPATTSKTHNNNNINKNHHNNNNNNNNTSNSTNTNNTTKSVNTASDGSRNDKNSSKHVSSLKASLSIKSSVSSSKENNKNNINNNNDNSNNSKSYSNNELESNKPTSNRYDYNIYDNCIGSDKMFCSNNDKSVRRSVYHKNLFGNNGANSSNNTNVMNPIEVVVEMHNDVYGNKIIKNNNSCKKYNADNDNDGVDDDVGATVHGTHNNIMSSNKNLNEGEAKWPSPSAVLNRFQHDLQLRNTLSKQKQLQQHLILQQQQQHLLPLLLQQQQQLLLLQQQQQQHPLLQHQHYKQLPTTFNDIDDNYNNINSNFESHDVGGNLNVIGLLNDYAPKTGTVKYKDLAGNMKKLFKGAGSDDESDDGIDEDGFKAKHLPRSQSLKRRMMKKKMKGVVRPRSQFIPTATDYTRLEVPVKSTYREAGISQKMRNMNLYERNVNLNESFRNQHITAGPVLDFYDIPRLQHHRDETNFTNEVVASSMSRDVYGLVDGESDKKECARIKILEQKNLDSNNYKASLDDNNQIKHGNTKKIRNSKNDTNDHKQLRTFLSDESISTIVGSSSNRKKIANRRSVYDFWGPRRQSTFKHGLNNNHVYCGNEKSYDSKIRENDDDNNNVNDNNDDKNNDNTNNKRSTRVNTISQLKSSPSKKWSSGNDGSRDSDGSGDDGNDNDDSNVLNNDGNDEKADDVGAINCNNNNNGLDDDDDHDTNSGSKCHSKKLNNTIFSSNSNKSIKLTDASTNIYNNKSRINDSKSNDNSHSSIGKSTSV